MLPVEASCGLKRVTLYFVFASFYRTTTGYKLSLYIFFTSRTPATTHKSTMPSERVIRFTHTFLFTLVLLASVVALGISGSLVGHYNSDGYPPFHTNAYRDRIRILLVASVWTTAWACKFCFFFGD